MGGGTYIFTPSRNGRGNLYFYPLPKWEGELIFLSSPEMGGGTYIFIPSQNGRGTYLL